MSADDYRREVERYVAEMNASVGVNIEVHEPEIHPGDVVAILDADGDKTYVVTREVPARDGMFTYELLPDPENEQ